MKNIDYIIRDDSKNRELSASELGQPINILQALKNDYYYLYESVDEDKYPIRLDVCDLFKEILYHDKVVGFATYNIQSESHYILTNIYIMSGYRRKSLFYFELKSHFSEEKIVSIHEPTRQVIEALIKYDYAREITDSLVISSINFNIDIEKALSVTDNKLKANKFNLTNIYDMNICATIFLRIFNQTKYDVCFTAVMDDDKRFGCEKQRQNLDKKYFDRVVSTLIDKDIEIERWLFLLRNHLPTKEIKTEEIIGKQKQFSQIILDSIDDEIITIKEAKLIQNQLFIELRTGKVEKKALELRLNYLIENYHKKTIRNNRTYNCCPYCYEDIDYLENYCINCGYTLYNLAEVDEEKFVYEALYKEKQSYQHSLKKVNVRKGSFSKEYSNVIATVTIINNIHDGIYDDDIFEYFANKLNIPEVDLEKFILENEYISFTMNTQKWKEESNNLKIVELKEILRANNCKISGNKDELIDRIEQEIPMDKIQSSIPHVTSKAMEYIDEHDVYLIHNLYLKDYVFEEFKEFFNECIRKGKADGIVDKFLDKHIEYAHQNRNHDQLVDSLRVKSEIHYNSNQYDEVIEYEIEVFLANLNMLYVDSNYRTFYKPIDKQTWEILNSFKKTVSNDYFSEIFNNVYRSFDENDLVVSYSVTVDILQDIFKHYSFNGLNNKIMRRYYKKKECKSIKFRKNDKSRITTLDSFFN